MTRIQIGFLAEALPVVEALQALGVDIGSTKVNSVVPGVPDGVRCLCAAVADRSEGVRLIRRIGAELQAAGHPEAVELIRLAVCQPLPLDAALVVWPALVCGEV